MMLDAEKWAEVKGFDVAYLCSMNDDFYKKCGYEKVESISYGGWFKKKI